MGLTRSRANHHIKNWEAKLRQSFAPYRGQWPLRLFHHTPIENAVEILTRGKLLSRNDSNKLRKRDVAGSAIIQHRQRAHQFGRLYFRPRTPTQYWIEGIRNRGDYYQNDPQAHAPTLVMLIFDARKILTMAEVRFSDGNMQADAREGDDDAFFDTIEFAKVYHCGGTGGDHSITYCRCAEVLVPSPLPINDYLTSIICRSKAERQTLLHQMGKLGRRWSKLIYVSDDLDVFEKRHTFVDTVFLEKDGVVFRLHPTGQTVDFQMTVWTETGKLLKSFQREKLPVTPPNGGRWWKVPVILADGVYRINITIENCVAYESDLPLFDDPF